MKWYLDIKKYLSGALPIEILLYLDNAPGCECRGSGMGGGGVGAVGWGQYMHKFCEETSRLTWIRKSLSDALQGLTPELGEESEEG